MSKYRCSTCGYKYEKTNKEFNNLKKTWICPICKSKKELFEIKDEYTNQEIKQIINSNTNKYDAVVIDKNNPSIERTEGCINCGMCRKTCLSKENIPNNENNLYCLGCGQCIKTCPKKVLEPKNEIWKFIKAKKEGKICIASISPASRITISEALNYNHNESSEELLVGILKNLGFDYVIDVSLGADLTIMEESYELLERIKENKLPLITSCCPSWVEYTNKFYPELLDNLSTSKSPISMLNSLIKNYLPNILNINKNNIYTVSITPCTSKKLEIKKEGLTDTNLIITINELVNYIKNKNIDITKIKPCKIDTPFGQNSQTSLKFGVTGGVTEAILRNIKVITKSKEKINYQELHNYTNIKETSITINNKKIRIAIIDELKNVKPILEDIKKGKSKYDFIEIMNCKGGCIGGGGNIIYNPKKEDIINKERIKSLINSSNNLKIKTAIQNPNIKKIYKELLNYPLSEKSQQLFHIQHKKVNNK